MHCYEDGDDDDPSKLSLMQRMRLFERPPVPELAAQQQQRKRRSVTSRFQTQPITVSEVHQARQFQVASPARRPPAPSPPLPSSLPLTGSDKTPNKNHEKKITN